MCGIAGALNLFPGPPPTRQLLTPMAHALRHRGPDGFGYYEDDDVGLAHARLSIIDIAGGAQPIHNEDRSVRVVFNGEIFNYLELRRELEDRGHAFYTQSDTEVIVHAYEEYGEDFVGVLNGQFAIALWDARCKRLVLARDRVGIRPLYYTRVRDRLYFASEVKALFAVPDVPRRFDLQALGQIFTYWSVLPPATPFACIEALGPGHIAVIERGHVRVKCYWDWEFPPHPVRPARDEAEYAEELRALLIDAVRLQLRADVPVGAYLSGGLDSSAITAVIKHYSDAPLRSFSVSFADDEYDESGYQQELVDHLGTTHSTVRCTRADIAAAFPQAVWHAETPIVRTAPAPLMLLSRAVHAAGFKVVLTGEGADEVFGGYDLFKEAKIRRFWAVAPSSRMRPAILAKLYPYLRHSPAATPAFREQFFRQGMEHCDRAIFAHVPRWTTTQRIWRLLHPDVRAALASFDAFAHVESRIPAESGRWPPMARDQYVEAHTLLSGYLLSSQGDRMAMANSVEGRFPFLDHRVIEFANRLPPQYKLRGLTEKYLLKQAVRGLVPDRIRTRTKQPYRAPDAVSFFDDRGAPVPYVAELFRAQRLRESGVFAPEAVDKLYAKCRAGQATGFGDNMSFIAVLSTLLVEDLFFKSDAHAAAPRAAGAI